MANHVVITSAIRSRFGEFDTEQRMSQTIGTIGSVLEKIPDCRVTVVEVSATALEPPQLFDIKATGADVMELNHHPTLQQIYQICPNDDTWVKTPGELLAMQCYMHTYSGVGSHDRIYKISGRYLLSADFDTQQHHRPGHLVVGEKMNPVQYYDTTGQKFPLVSPWQYSTRLYSFCGSLWPHMQKLYQDMWDLVMSMYKTMQFTDIEHALYAMSRNLPVHEIKPLGVQGYQAPNGRWMHE